MEDEALAAFAALSDRTRLRILRHLVQAGPEGLAAGAVGRAVDATSSRTAFHLKQLEHAGLVRSRRDGRFAIYTAAYPALAALVGFLMRDCCQGRPEICTPAIDALACCVPDPKV
nr:metalloregulator ArsR/SmtB family transcription factor [Falsirhodobacter algicola]